jgi:hypothetical protein
VIRLALLSVLAVLTWLYFPDSRAMLLAAAEPVITPVMRWGAREEMAQVGRNAVDHERLTGELPAGRAWLEWLDHRYFSPELRRDPWGSVYQLSVWQDSVGILSYGPDRTRGTEDDFYVPTRRE